MLTASCGGVAHSPRKPRSVRRYWGVELAQPPTTAAAMKKLTRRLDALTGRTASIESINEPFETCAGVQCRWDWLPAEQLQMIRAAGAIPMLNWSSMSSPLHVLEPGYRLSQIAGGAFDSYLRAFANSVAHWRHPLFIRFNWEMNGAWFPWATTTNMNTPSAYVAAWRHVHAIFAAAGATNVSWVWCPNVQTVGASAQYAAAYPGAAYVDWTCLDGYNWGRAHGRGGWVSFDRLFAGPYRQLTALAPGKPLMIGEVASAESGGSKATWIRQMFDDLAHGYAGIKAVVWFNASADHAPWPIDSTPASADAFRAGLTSGQYRNGVFTSLSRPP